VNTINGMVLDMTWETEWIRTAWPAYGMADDVTGLVRKMDVAVLVVGADGSNRLKG
jgi:hypothetical protein